MRATGVLVLQQAVSAALKWRKGGDSNQNEENGGAKKNFLEMVAFL